MIFFNIGSQHSLLGLILKYVYSSKAAN